VTESTGGIVRIEPLGAEIEVRPGESLMPAAQRQGYVWPNVCGGQGNCTVCHVLLEQGAENASQQALWERERLHAAAKSDPRTRLACQLKVSGRVIVSKRGVRLPPAAVR
jgi:2Fe-2S ferredoxin